MLRASIIKTSLELQLEFLCLLHKRVRFFFVFFFHFLSFRSGINLFKMKIELNLIEGKQKSNGRCRSETSDRKKTEKKNNKFEI